MVSPPGASANLIIELTVAKLRGYAVTDAVHPVAVSWNRFELKLNVVGVGVATEAFGELTASSSVTGAGATAKPDSAVPMLAAKLRLQFGCAPCACAVFQVHSVPAWLELVTR